MDVAAGRISILPGRGQLDRLDGGITLNPRIHGAAVQNLRHCEGRGQEKSALHLWGRAWLAAAYPIAPASYLPTRKEKK